MFLEKENVQRLWSNIIYKSLSSRYKQLEVDSHKIEFEGKFNWDCIIDFYCRHQCINGDDTSPIYVFCELKPLLGDDYPCVLRKMKTQLELTKEKYYNEYGGPVYALRYLLLVKEYASSTTSKEQLIQIFNQNHIRVVFIDELFDHVPTQGSIQPTQTKIEVEENRLLRDALLQAQEKIARLEEEIKLLQTPK
jgi:hypothetical protein